MLDRRAWSDELGLLSPIIFSPITPGSEEVQRRGWVLFPPTDRADTFHMAAAAIGYPFSSRGLPRLSIDSTSTMSSGISGPVSSSPSASSSTSSPPLHSSSLLDAQMADGVITKIEELEDGDELRNVPPLPSPTEPGEPSKRGRGRPRKHPLPPIGAQQKVTKGRSKTGCITCRRRKKKCDETKPECSFAIA